MSNSHQYRIAILLPTRGRTDMLKRSLESLVSKAKDPASIQFILGFDNDDTDSQQYFEQQIAPVIDDSGAGWEFYEFQRLGYDQLHLYVNQLASYADADWFIFWNDDAVMIHDNWDEQICAHTGQFKVLAFDTHNKHPYSIFPIVPSQLYRILCFFSRHQLNDAYISQMAYLLDIMVRTDIKVEHDRFDLTGQNKDATYEERRLYEGNPSDPRDFNHISMVTLRSADTDRIAEWMKSEGLDTSYWDNVKAGRQDPWAKMRANDVNKFLALSQ